MRTKRVGILTFHFSDNYGAILQCYALKESIGKITNYNAEIINYIPQVSRKWFAEVDLEAKYQEKIKLFDEFRGEKLEIVSKTMNYKELNNLKNQFDTIVVGSDQVWNPSFQMFHTAYFLDFAGENTNKVSYAASIALPIDDPCLLRNQSVFEKYLPMFDSISVREKTHIEFLRKFTDKRVYSVLDPSLLLEAKDYNKLIEERPGTDERFIFLYYLKHDSMSPLLLSFVNMLSRTYNLKVIHSFVNLPAYVLPNKTESFYFTGPKDFIWYIKNAQIVVTNSFHGTAFSVLYQKPFYTYVVQSMGSRIFDFLSSLGLENRIINGYKNINDVEFEMDFSDALNRLEVLRQESIDYLRNSLA